MKSLALLAHDNLQIQVEERFHEKVLNYLDSGKQYFLANNDCVIVFPTEYEVYTFTVIMFGDYGSRFNTVTEEQCIFIKWVGEAYTHKFSPTGWYRNFLALDSDGIECQFSTGMVKGHPDFFEVIL